MAELNLIKSFVANMRIIFAAVILVCAFIPSQSAKVKFQDCNQKMESDCYYVVAEKPKGLREFEHFWVNKVENSSPFSMSGKAYVNNVYIDLTGRIEGGHVYFQTATANRSSYEFAGRFLRGGKVYKGNKIFIEGMLTKFKRDGRIISMKVAFYIGRGHNS